MERRGAKDVCEWQELEKSKGDKYQGISSTKHADFLWFGQFKICPEHRLGM
jgi:hypothetical protein